MNLSPRDLPRSCGNSLTDCLGTVRGGQIQDHGSTAPGGWRDRSENSGPADQGRCLVITGTASLRSVLSGNVPGTIRA
jgi:hypothetical protein